MLEWYCTPMRGVVETRRKHHKLKRVLMMLSCEEELICYCPMAVDLSDPEDAMASAKYFYQKGMKKFQEHVWAPVLNE